MSVTNLLRELLTKEPAVFIGAATGLVVVVLQSIGIDATAADVSSVVVGILGILGIRSKVSPA